MEILFGGDLVINRTYAVEQVDERLLSLFRRTDLNVLNLEAPVTSSNSKIPKTGPHLKADKDSILGVLKALEVDVVTLANNHVLDYDEEGVSDTLSFCAANNIRNVGAGMNLQQASQTLIIEAKQGGRIALVNFAETEWATAAKENAGANPMDLIDNVKQIREARSKADFVFVVVHGGNEYNPYPSPRMVKQYRFYAENGADAVIGHHTHCISGYERYQGVPIFYSLGNFLFTTRKPMSNSWYTGLLVKMKLEIGKEIGFEVIPVAQSQENHALSIPGEAESAAIRTMLREINAVIADEVLLEKKWEEFVQSMEDKYIKTISPLAGIKNRYLRGALYRMKAHKLFLHDRYVREFLNRIRCEAHYDVTRRVFQRLAKRP